MFLLSIGGGMMPPDTQSPIQAWYMMTDFIHRLTDADVVVRRISYVNVLVRGAYGRVWNRSYGGRDNMVVNYNLDAFLWRPRKYDLYVCI